MTTQQLIGWIGRHDTAEPTIDNQDGTLTVACWVSDVSGNWTIERSVIPATLQAARDWLEY